jgi:chaperonin cofactor prefoldin
MATEELDKRLKKLEDQMGWILARYTDTGDNPKIEKLEIQVNCLRKQVLDIEGKKSYSESFEEL